MPTPDDTGHVYDPMEPHQLALAALDHVAQSVKADTSHHDRVSVAGKVTSSNPTAGYMKSSTPDKDIVHNAAYNLQSPQRRAKSDRIILPSGPGHEDASDTDVAMLGQISSNNSQFTTDGHDAASTPPTSTCDGFSSQSTNPDAPLSQLSQLSQLAAAQEPFASTSAARPILAVAPTAGQKRTADGLVKPLSVSPTSPKRLGHSRNTSAVSNASSVSRIGEVGHRKNAKGTRPDYVQLSSELRTRLSYAMVKVNNGWQSNSIDEVESLASQAGSPTSSTSTMHGRRNVITSPRTAIANLQPHPSSSAQSMQAPPADFDLYPRGDQPSRTYESFWRDHSTASYPQQRQNGAIASPPGSKSLGPPADIRPTLSSRRAGTPKFSKPPTLSNHGSHSPYNNNNTSAPRTPLRTDYRDNTIIQAPSQKTIQEQDAIETLLFMSSPGNPGNMGHAFPPPRTQGSPQQSPLRAEFHAQGRVPSRRRVEFDATATSVSAESSEGAEYRVKMRGNGGSRSRAKSEEMNRILDEMRDSSSDEEELPLQYTSPRRLAA